jgi:hypothetical protein
MAGHEAGSGKLVRKENWLGKDRRQATRDSESFFAPSAADVPLLFTSHQLPTDSPDEAEIFSKSEQSSTAVAGNCDYTSSAPRFNSLVADYAYGVPLLSR